MGSFDKDISYIIEKKNEVYSKKENLKERINEFDERRAEVEEGIARIPDDLPEELQQQVDVAVENARAELRSEADEIGEEADVARNEADGAIDLARNTGDDLNQKAEKLRGLSGIPLIGSFAETKASELNDRAEDMFDLAKETQQYQDELILERNKLYENR